MPLQSAKRTDAQRECDARYREAHRVFLRQEQRLVREVAKTRHAIEQCNAGIGRDEYQLERMPVSDEADMLRSLIAWNTRQLDVLRQTLPDELAQLEALRANRPKKEG